MLLPESRGGSLEWKIWTLSTWVVDLRDFLENEELLRAPSDKSYQEQDEIVTEVLIVGGGNA